MSILNRYFTNNTETTLTSGVSDVATTLPVASPTGLTPPAGKHIIATLKEGENMEVVEITGVSGSNLTVARGREGTTAQAFTTAAQVSVNITADTLNKLINFLTPGAWGDMVDLTSDAISLDILATIPYPTGMRLSSDGTQLYVSNNSDVHWYILSTAWDLSSAIYDSSFYINGIKGFCFSADGTKLFVLVSEMGAITIKAYSLGTAWDVSTSVFSTQSGSLFTLLEGSSTAKLEVSPTGLSFYLMSDGADNIVKLTASTAFNVSTISTTPSSTLPLTASADLRGLSIKPDELRILVAEDSDGIKIKGYNLPSTGALSSAVFDAAYTPSQSPTVPFGDICVSSTGDYVFVLKTQDFPTSISVIDRYSW